MIITYVDQYKFVDDSLLSEMFSFEARRALFDIYDSFEADCTFDPVAIGCDWVEYV